MKRITYLLLMVLAVSSISLSGCKKDEEPAPTDVRDQGLGTYVYTAKFYDMTSGTPSYLSGIDQTGTMIMKKGASSSLIEFWEDGSLAFRGDKVTKASNGFAFDIPQQIIEDDGDQIQITGYDIVDLGSSKYDGVYYSDTKKSKAAFTSTVSGVEILVKFEFIKQ